MQSFFAEKNFSYAIFNCFLFGMSLHTKTNVCQHSRLLVNDEFRYHGLLQVKKCGKKSQKFLQRKFFICASILFFTFERCVDVSKLFLPSFKAVRHFWREFFS